MDPRILLDRLSHVRYGHPDLQKAKEFFTDFGLTPVRETETKIYFRGFGIDQFCYVAEKTSDGRRKFRGGAWIVLSMAELEKAAKLPGSTPIADYDAPGGGKVVIVKDIVGEEITLIYGQQDRVPEPREVPKPVMWNTWEDKRRLGEFQRPDRDQPSKVHKLGHYGFEVNVDRLHEVFDWYAMTFNLKKTDCLFDPSGFVVEHYVDGDLVNEDSKHANEPAVAAVVSSWGPDIPRAFFTKKYEDLPGLKDVPEMPIEA
ncbi:hypothetical protein N0V92_000465 [Colletotrichum tropicale]|nr:hypothetical protein N0V92_000465 [Colletotrichum tropicale]